MRARRNFVPLPVPVPCGVRVPGRVSQRVSSIAVALALAFIACGDSQEPRELQHATVPFIEKTGEELHEDYTRPYAFSDDWFSKAIPTWRRALGSLTGKPDLHYLEIGVFEGRSFIWMLEHVFTHPTSRLTAVDIFTPAEIEDRFLANIALSGQADRVTTIKGYSQVELRKLPLDSFDVIYVDGSHTADDVLADAILSWGLLKTGGFLIFDDYLWDGSYYTGTGRHLPGELAPAMGINAFIQTYRSYIEVVHHEYQMILRKRENPCPNKSMCSPIGQYVYDWREGRLSRIGDPTVVPLSKSDQRLLERIFWKRRVGEHGYVLTPELASDPRVRALKARLDPQAAPRKQR